jgi:two-component sensor histidine kinase
MNSTLQESKGHPGARPKLGNARWRISRDSRWAYAIALLCVAVASLLHLVFGLVRPDNQHFTTFYPAVLFAAVFGGARPGVFAALLSGIIAWWAFMAPHFTFTRDFDQVSSTLAYLFASLVIVWGVDRYRRITKRLEDEEKFRRLAVEELAHRLKNKIATIQSIISYQLRDNPETRDAIVGRLTALSATDDLILATQGKGAHLRDILSTELDPYEASRIAFEGPSTLLAPKLAMTMAMLVHELATNSAKYGALSTATGKLTICSSLSDARLNLEWRESGGPIVTSPARRGFGLRLLTRALDQFGGTVETTFEPTGLICTLSAPLPEEDATNIAPDATSTTQGTEFQSPSATASR